MSVLEDVSNIQHDYFSLKKLIDFAVLLLNKLYALTSFFCFSSVGLKKRRHSILNIYFEIFQEVLVSNW
jgi:hypothetical protein